MPAGRKELFEPEIEKRHGRIFKLMGDGLLAEFASVVDAVECAVSLQRGLAERNAVLPEEQRVQVRIGINLGEVIVEGEDRYGEGVNIAARLQQLAEPGRHLVSGKVAREVEKKLAFGFESLGDQQVKNIAEPVPAYRVVAEKPASSALSAKFDSLPSRPALVVLPFANLGDDPGQGWFADGVVDDMITALSRFRSFAVIARNSAFVYKGRCGGRAAGGAGLGVRYVLEGSVRRAGGAMRIICAAGRRRQRAGSHLWAEHFDGRSEELFEFRTG